jgi:hypothetical protein
VHHCCWHHQSAVAISVFQARRALEHTESMLQAFVHHALALSTCLSAAAREPAAAAAAAVASPGGQARICGLGSAALDRFDLQLQLGADQAPLRMRLGECCQAINKTRQRTWLSCLAVCAGTYQQLKRPLGYAVACSTSAVLSGLLPTNQATSPLTIPLTSLRCVLLNSMLRLLSCVMHRAPHTMPL